MAAFLDRARPGLAVLVLPVALSAFSDPLDGLRDAGLAGGFALGVGDPVGVLALAGGAEAGPDFLRCFVFLEGSGEVGGCFGCRAGGLLGARHGFGAVVDESCGLLDVAGEDFVGREIFEGGDLAERAHAVAVDALLLEPCLHGSAEEAEAAVGLEGGEVAEHLALVGEEGHGPLDALFDIGDGLMDELTEVGEDRLGEGRGAVDVGVDAGVEGGGGFHGGESIASCWLQVAGCWLVVRGWRLWLCGRDAGSSTPLPTGAALRMTRYGWREGARFERYTPLRVMIRQLAQKGTISSPGIIWK